jgi:hypothetical protein
MNRRPLSDRAMGGIAVVVTGAFLWLVIIVSFVAVLRSIR